MEDHLRSSVVRTHSQVRAMKSTCHHFWFDQFADFTVVLESDNTNAISLLSLASIIQIYDTFPESFSFGMRNSFLWCSKINLAASTNLDHIHSCREIDLHLLPTVLQELCISLQPDHTLCMVLTHYICSFLWLCTPKWRIFTWRIYGLSFFCPFAIWAKE